MQLTVQATTRPTPHGAFTLAFAQAINVYLVGVKPYVRALRPGIVGMPGSTVCLLYTSDAADE